MKLPIRQPARLAWLALLLAAGAMLLSASGAQAASKRGAVLVKDIRPGPAPSVTEPDSSCGCISYAGGELTNVGGTLYFSAEDGHGAGRHGYELWRSDGTRKGTRMVKDINPGAGSSNIDGITGVNRILYFRADDGSHGFELWRSDGTARGTRMVKDINPAGSSYPGGFTNVNGTLYFSADDGSHGFELWRSDGTEAGTRMVKDIDPGGSSSRSGFTNVNDTLYFSASDGTGYGLWRSDGTEAGTSLVKQFGIVGIVGILPLIDVSGTLYFGFYDSSSSHGGLWRSDGTEAGTGLIKQGFDVGTLEFSGFRGTLYFLGDDGLHGPALWRSDGTAARTALVKRAKVAFSEPTDFKGKLYLGDHRALWRSDGTRRGTKVIRGFPGYRPSSLTAVKRTLYFAGADKKHGEELWRSDGTRKGTRMVWDIRHRRDIRRGSISSSPRNLTAVGSTLFFTAADGRHGEELWRAGAKPRKKGKPKRKKG